MVGCDPNKAKTARRVIEVLEFFDEHRRQATVMEIARRYNRPQSSTSELLAILVEMGLLYKDPRSRSYTPTPRAAMLGSVSQPSLVRDGRLSMLVDRLVAQTGIGTTVMGMVGLDAQIFRWMPGALPVPTTQPNGLSGGLRERLCDTAAGWLLLSTMAPERRAGVLRRLRAETPSGRSFDHASLNEQIQTCARQGHVVGPVGFGAKGQMCAVLLPSDPGERPMVLGFVYEPQERIDPASLVARLQKSVQACVNPMSADRPPIAPMVSSAA
jgi:DNA-binding IclR family transcriptional regulator